MTRAGIPVVLALVVVGWVGPLAHTVAAETLFEREGIELSGSVRVVARGVGTCEVREESHSEGYYEQIKDNHGQPLNVWRLDYSAYNGSGKPLAFLRAHFRVESQWPPCTSWSGPEGSYSKPVQWTGSFQVLKKPYGMGPGEEVSDTIFVLAFHEHRPRFESWDVNYRFGKPMAVPAGGGSCGTGCGEEDGAKSGCSGGATSPTQGPGKVAVRAGDGGDSRGEFPDGLRLGSKLLRR